MRAAPVGVQRVLRSCPPLLLLRLPLSALAAVARRSTRHEERRTAATALSRGGASAAGERVTIQPQVLGEYSPRRVGAGGGRGRMCSGRGPGYAHIGATLSRQPQRLGGCS